MAQTSNTRVNRMISKRELSEILNVSATTLSNWLNVRYYDELIKIGYSKKQHLLFPKQVKWLANKLDFDLEFTRLN